MAQIPWNKAKAIADEHEPKFVLAMTRLKFEVLSYTTEAARNTKKYRDHDNIPFADFIFEDLLTGQQLHVELKTKGHPVYYGLDSEWRHGNEYLVKYAIASYRDTIPTVIVFEEPFMKEFTYPYYYGKQSPKIDIGGYWIQNVGILPLKQEHGNRKGYQNLYYYRRQDLLPLEEIRSVAGWKDESNGCIS